MGPSCKIINLTRDITLSDNAVIADTLSGRIKGLIGRKKLKSGEALVIKPCNSVHTFFMSFSIDLLFVDSQERIVKIVQAMPPFRLSSISLNASYVIELPAGIISSTQTKIGDRIRLIPANFYTPGV